MQRIESAQVRKNCKTINKGTVMLGSTIILLNSNEDPEVIAFWKQENATDEAWRNIPMTSEGKIVPRDEIPDQR